ncbi:MAG: F0F1 ATP synthase subunit alpha [Nitrospira sp. LK70]|nr:F0F1 ATP synthase subunit alpha [Nitrospira sp. LK70]
MLRNSLLSGQAAWLDQYRLGLRIMEQGRVRSVGDGVVWIEGLPSAAMEEILLLEDGSRALVFHLANDRLGGILLTQTTRLTAGTIAHLSGQRLSLPVGDQLIGRVINPLGDALDGQPSVDSPSRRELFASSPPIVARDFVHRPLYTGSKVVDTLIPVAKGQRQLIIGDNGIGKRAFALDTIINQRGKNVRCVYVSIGQKRSSIVDAIDTLKTYGAMEYTAIVAAEATALPGLKYLAPFAGCALVEGWMWEGQDTLVVYDDLTTHAQTYRELSLLLRRPPGREAYPGDIFFLHSRLLERSTCLAPSLGGGSMTALPVVETTQGEIAAYIPTNLISITDGQIYFDTRLFAAGTIPAIDVTKSVSRIGGKGQHPRIKEQAGRMKLDFLQFLELEVFTRFGAKLEATMEAKIKRGRVLREILKQDRLAPLPIEFQLAWLTGFNRGLFDDVPPGKIGLVMKRVESHISMSRLTLDQRDELWAEAVTSWLKEDFTT